MGECMRQYQPAYARGMDGPPKYFGEICFVGGRDTFLFRLYDAKSRELLVERLFFDADRQLIWYDGGVIYNMGAPPRGN